MRLSTLQIFLGLWMCLPSCLSQDTFYFNIKPQNKDVVEGMEVRLYCDVSDRRHIYFQWTQAGKPVMNTSRKYQEDSNLRIQRVLRGEDEGPFQCIATNSTTGFSLQSQEAVLNILWLEDKSEVILRRPKKEEISQGTDIILKCQVSGNPEPTILWYHNKFRLFNTDRLKILDGGGRLKLANISGADNGVYSCRAENTAGTVDSSENFFLNVRADGSPQLQSEYFTPFKLALKYQDARLDCPFEGATRIDWFSNYEKLSNSTRHVVYPNGSLYFPKVRAADEGTYRCEGFTHDSPAQTFTSELVLADLDDITSQTFEPRLLPSYPVVIPVRERFEIKVFPPAGRPQPEFRWLDRSDRVIGDTGRIHVQNLNLVFEAPGESDSGNYTFIANNTAAERRQSVWIIVSVPPMISRGPQSLTVNEDSSASFSCQIAGTPYPVTVVLWTKDGIALPMGSKVYQISPKEGTLLINQVRASDAGNYTCVVNTTGHSVVLSAPATLWVSRKLKFEPIPDEVYYLELDKAGSIKCQAAALTPPDIHWLKVGHGENKLPGHMYQDRGVLYFRQVRREDEGRYMCVAEHRNQGRINVTVSVRIVEKPSFNIRPPNVTTAFEGQLTMLHCVAVGDPRPQVSWDKDGRFLAATGNDGSSTTTSRFTLFANGTLLLQKVLIEDKGRYGCMANNTAGKIRTEFNLIITPPVEEDKGFDMAKTVVIAVCSAGAYLALVIGLTAYCSYRLLLQRKTRKQLINTKNLKLGTGEFHHHHHREQHELLMKDRDSSLPFRSDSDNRSHASGLSSHPSHSSTSASAPGSHVTSSAPGSHMTSSAIAALAAAARTQSPSLDKMQFPRQNLQTLGVIGKSRFGDVFLARARSIRSTEPETLVVVKSLLVKGEGPSIDFHNDIDMYSKLDHPHIVRLLGVCREAEPFFMITEYCDWGDLKQFLLATRGDTGRRAPAARVPQLSPLQKLKLCQQVALGMEYLSGYKFIHRDLAARNILLTSRMDLKICSLSLCQDVYSSEYFSHPGRQVPIPLRWLPPEAVKDGEYSFHTDIWSYGVFMWEVFHLCDLPYRLLSDEDIYKCVCGGTGAPPRLEFSELCPSPVLNIVTQCCATVPSSRPTFSDLVVTLSHLLTNGDCV